MKLIKLSYILNAYRDKILTSIYQFFQSGRSAYVFLCGIALIILSGVVMLATFDSREAHSAPAGWERFVAASGTNQWVSASFLLSSGCIVLSVNYLPRLEGEVWYIYVYGLQKHKERRSFTACNVFLFLTGMEIERIYGEYKGCVEDCISFLLIYYINTSILILFLLISVFFPRGLKESQSLYRGLKEEALSCVRPNLVCQRNYI